MISENKNITDQLYHIAINYPKKLAFLHPIKISYSKFCNLIDLYASGLQHSGIKKGKRTVVLIKPGIDLFAVTFALLRIGAIPIMIDPGMGIKAMAKALSEAKPEVLIGIPKSMSLKYLFSNSFKSVKIWISTGSNLCWLRKTLKTFRRKNCTEYEVANIDSNDIVAVFFTSGSTGPAKGVVYKSFMFEAQLQLLKNYYKYNPEEIDLCTFPFFGLFSICLGLSVVMADMNMMRPSTLNPLKITENINRFGCTYMFCSPMVFKKLVDYNNKANLKLFSLKKVMVAGAEVSPLLLQSALSVISKNTDIHVPYGATEALPVTDITHNEILNIYRNKNQKFDGICIGTPLENLNLKIIKITDNQIINWKNASICSTGEIGEIVVYGENVTQSYFNNENANSFSKIIDSSGMFYWHRTGDLGRLDEAGRIWFYGRKSHRVETNSGTLFTVTTETVFNQNSAVERSALVGIIQNGITTPVICIQLIYDKINKNKLTQELKYLALKYEHTKNIKTFLFRKKFPVDPRHNAKIYREKLAKWAQKKIN